MRIKTSSNVEKLLSPLKDFLKYEYNAQVLKLAISFAINDNNLYLEDISEDGFEIDINVLFGEEKLYYEKLIEYKMEEEPDKHLYSKLIEYGIEKINYYAKICKYDRDKFLKKVLEDLCI